MSDTPTNIKGEPLSKTPSIHKSAFVARGAQVIGDVRIAAQASIWFNSVLRGDINYISIGERTNIQDGCILHLENELPCVVGADVTVGHGAILHGCVIEENCLIGMGAIILSGVVIKKGSVIAAGALVRENSIVEPYSLMAGIPARLIRRIPESNDERLREMARKYAVIAQLHQEKGLGA
jgi:carbonic anhydrase/acetyltransferase-like protein (isoleucine patch superfamily)